MWAKGKVLKGFWVITLVLFQRLAFSFPFVSWLLQRSGTMKNLLSTKNNQNGLSILGPVIQRMDRAPQRINMYFKKLDIALSNESLYPPFELLEQGVELKICYHLTNITL